MRRLFHKVVCTAPGVTEFGNGVLRVKCKQNTVVEMPCGVWLANWRRHSDKLILVDDSFEEGTIYPPVVEPEPLPEPVQYEPEVDVPIAIDAPHPRIPPLGQQPKRTYNKKAK